MLQVDATGGCSRLRDFICLAFPLPLFSPSTFYGCRPTGILEGMNAIKETWQQNLARSLVTAPWVVSESVKVRVVAK